MGQLDADRGVGVGPDVFQQRCEGLRLREPDGMWASYDVLDVWYQKAEFGDVWMPYLHVRVTPGEAVGTLEADPYSDDFAAQGYEQSYAAMGGGR